MVPATSDPERVELLANHTHNDIPSHPPVAASPRTGRDMAADDQAR
jgi:hypothetical protein